MSRDLLEGVRSRLAELEHDADLGRDVPTLLRAGRHDEAWERVPQLLGDGRGKPCLKEQLLAARVLMVVHDYEPLPVLFEALAAENGDDAGARRMLYRWWFLSEDFERLEKVLAERRGEANDSSDLVASARLKAQMHELEAAGAAYKVALERATSDAEKASALHGLGIVHYRRRRFDAALETLGEALRLTPLDADLLANLADALIRLGRTAEAIDAFELALEVAPYHERAHYFLGNGYARRDYTQLEATWGKVLSAAGERVHDGARAFAAGDYAVARRHFVGALKLCPEYGRAHSGLARTVEAQRLAVSVYRRRYEKAFAAREEPRVEGIETYVINWHDLRPRHRKQVALAIAPWARWIPVLHEAGADHYIKPLDLRLSECPGCDLQKDRRIDYDSRLWDDVRGCGGYHTVTGLEDVERTISNGSNTVLHELTHQVHQVMGAAERRRIQELYRRAKERDTSVAPAGRAFLSRYAGSSVWEYFAEGANALETPRRDRFDRREIVRERLEERDPELKHLVLDLMDGTGLDDAWAMAAVNRGFDQLRRGHVDEAIAAYRRALERSSTSEDARASLIYALGVAGHAAEALELAHESVALEPASAALATGHATSLWLTGQGLGRATAALEAARAAVREEERFELDLCLAWMSWTAGDAEATRRAAEAVLAYQSDHPHGLWNLAAAHALAGRLQEAWPLYDETVRQRTGNVDLRASYADDLLRAGELERARREIDAALLLAPDDPEVLALESRWMLARGEIEKSCATAERALELGPWNDQARLALAQALRRRDGSAAAARVLEPLLECAERETPPEYVYRGERAAHALVHTLPAVLRADLAREHEFIAEANVA